MPRTEKQTRKKRDSPTLVEPYSDLVSPERHGIHIERKQRTNKRFRTNDASNSTEHNGESGEDDDPDALNAVSVDGIHFQQGINILACFKEYPKAIPAVQRGAEMHRVAIVSILNEIWRTYQEDEDYHFGRMVLSKRSDKEFAILDSLQRQLVVLIFTLELLRAVKPTPDVREYTNIALQVCSQFVMIRGGEGIGLFIRGKPTKKAMLRWPRFKAMYSTIQQYVKKMQAHLESPEGIKFVEYFLRRCHFDALVIEPKASSVAERTKKEGILFILLNFTRDLPPPQSLICQKAIYFGYEPEKAVLALKDNKAVAWIERVLMQYNIEDNQGKNDGRFETMHWFLVCLAKGKQRIVEAEDFEQTKGDFYRREVNAIMMHHTEPELISLMAVILGMLDTDKAFDRLFGASPPVAAGSAYKPHHDVARDHSVVKLLGLLQAFVVVSLAIAHHKDMHDYNCEDSIDHFLLVLCEWWENPAITEDQYTDHNLLQLLHRTVFHRLERAFDINQNFELAEVIAQWSDLTFMHCSYSLYTYTAMLSHSYIHLDRNLDEKPNSYPHLYTHAKGPRDEPQLLVRQKGCKTLLRKVYDNTIDYRQRPAAECRWHGLSAKQGQTKMQAKISDYLTKKLPEKQVQVSAPLLMRYPVKGGMRQLVADDIEGKQVMSVKTTLREFCRSFPDTYLLAPPHVPAPSVTPAYCKRLLNSVEDGIPFIGAFEVFEIRDMRDRNNTSTKHYIIDGLVAFETATALACEKATPHSRTKFDLSRVDPMRSKYLNKTISQIKLKNKAKVDDTLSEHMMLHNRTIRYTAKTDAQLRGAEAKMAGEVYKRLRQKEYFRPSDMYRALVTDGKADTLEAGANALPFLATMCQSLGNINYNAFDLVLYIAAFLHFRFTNSPVFPHELGDNVYTTVRKVLLHKDLPRKAGHVMEMLQELQDQPEDTDFAKINKLVIRSSSAHVLLMYATIANPVGGIGDVVSRWKAQNIAVAIYHTSFVSVILGVQGLPESHTYAVANKVAWVAAIIKKRLPESDWETLFINVAFGLWCNDPTVTSVRVSDVIPSLDQPTCFLYKGAGGKELWDKRDQIQEIITQGDVNEAFDTLAHDCNDFIKLLYLYDTDGVEILKPVFQDQIYWDGQLVTYQVIAAGGHRRYNKTAPKGRKSNTYKIVR